MKHQVKPYKGYLMFLRAILLIFQTKSLDTGLLGTFIAFASECDWDKRHLTYGCLTKPDSYFAQKWGWNLSTVWRKKRELMDINCLIKTPEGNLRLNYIEWFRSDIVKRLARTEFATAQELIAETQEVIAKSQGDIADMQDSQDQNGHQSSSVSYKSNLRLSNRDNSSDSHSPKDYLDDEELDRISREEIR